MGVFRGIPAACELYCGAEHVQWSRQEDGSWVQCTRQKSCKEPSRQSLSEEIRELIFSKALKNLGKIKSVGLNIATAYIYTLCPFLVGLMGLQSIFWLLGFLIFTLFFIEIKMDKLGEKI